MKSLSPIGRALALLSMLGFSLLIGAAVIRWPIVTYRGWIALFAIWLVPAVCIVIVERRQPPSG